MTMNLRAGLVGLGMMGGNHARILSNLPGVDFIAAYDAAGNTSHAVKKEIIYNSLSSFKALNLDYCVIAVPTAVHEESALELISMGCHLLIEKPITHDSTSALNLQEALKNSGLRGAIGQIERYNPALAKARELIEQNTLGKIYEVFTRRQGWFPTRIVDVGVVKDLATHDIDLTSWILKSKYEKVSAFAGYQTNQVHEDIVSITALMSGGIVVNHIIDWLSPNKIRETRILGEKGCLIADTLNCTLAFHPNELYDPNVFAGVIDGNVINYKLDKKEPLLLEHQAFRDYINGNSENVASVASGIEVLKVCEAVLESIKSGNSVSLDDN
jgi:UDP-N-acetylglucosamine 3-dehydrogenase